MNFHLPIFLSIFLLFIFTGTAQGRTHTLVISSSSSTTIDGDDKIDGNSVEPGDHIILMGGSTSGGVTNIRAAVTFDGFKGKVGAPITIKNPSNLRVEFSSRSSWALQFRNSRHIRLLGSNNSDFRYGIMLKSGIRVRGNTTDIEIGYVHVKEGQKAGIRYKPHTIPHENALIHNNLVENTGQNSAVGEGMYIGNNLGEGTKMRNVSISSNCVLNNLSEEGIQVKGAGSESGTIGGVIRNNYVENVDDDGISLHYGASEMVVEGNVVLTASSYGIVQRQSDRGNIIIRDNFIKDSAKENIRAESSILVIDNLLLGKGITGGNKSGNRQAKSGDSDFNKLLNEFVDRQSQYLANYCDPNRKGGGLVNDPTPDPDPEPDPDPIPDPVPVPDPAPAPNGGTQLLQAESANLKSPMETKSFSDPDGGSLTAIGIKNGASGTGAADLTFSVNQTADYYFWARTLGPSSADNSFHISLDQDRKDSVRSDGETTIWSIPVSSDFVWTQIQTRVESGSKDLKIRLSSGQHTLFLNEREDGAYIDALVVTDDPNFRPEDLENLPDPDPVPDPDPIPDPDPVLEPDPAAELIEAETASLESPMKVKSFSGAGGETIDAIGTVKDSSGKGAASLQFSVAQSARYYFWARTLASSKSVNSFHISIDEDRIDSDRTDGETTVWSLPIANEFVWKEIKTRVKSGSDKLVLDLSAGQHTLFLNEREDGAYLDAIVVTDDPNFNPDGL